MCDFVYIRPSIYCLKSVKRNFYQRYNAGLIPFGYKGVYTPTFKDGRTTRKVYCPRITVLVSELPEIFDWLKSQPLSDRQKTIYEARVVGVDTKHC